MNIYYNLIFLFLKSISNFSSVLLTKKNYLSNVDDFFNIYLHAESIDQLI